VFHTDIAAANLQVGPDGKVPEETPGFKISDFDNIDTGGSQSRVIDLTQPGTYLFRLQPPRSPHGQYAHRRHRQVVVVMDAELGTRAAPPGLRQAVARARSNWIWARTPSLAPGKPWPPWQPSQAPMPARPL
jgi:hypothetical protein